MGSLHTGGSTHEFECSLRWTGAERGATRDYKSYSREYRIDIAGKPPLIGSAAPPFLGDGSLPNPEDMLMCALSACHCLSYLAICARAGIEVIAYEDHAHGVMKPQDGVMRFTDVLLRPRVTLAPGSDLARAQSAHHEAHAACFIANSVNFPVRNEAEVRIAAP
jgi:organic hydroperoxide reductase OsmC/OhrA